MFGHLFFVFFEVKCHTLIGCCWMRKQGHDGWYVGVWCEWRDPLISSMLRNDFPLGPWVPPGVRSSADGPVTESFVVFLGVGVSTCTVPSNVTWHWERDHLRQTKHQTSHELKGIRFIMAQICYCNTRRLTIVYNEKVTFQINYSDFNHTAYSHTLRKLVTSQQPEYFVTCNIYNIYISLKT